MLVRLSLSITLQASRCLLWLCLYERDLTNRWPTDKTLHKLRTAQRTSNTDPKLSLPETPLWTAGVSGGRGRQGKSELARREFRTQNSDGKHFTAEVFLNMRSTSLLPRSSSWAFGGHWTKTLPKRKADPYDPHSPITALPHHGTGQSRPGTHLPKQL